jgi:tRNA threonylcarbamoyladenosine dehydratase
MNWLERTELLLGEAKLKQLKNAHVLVAGMGGVGAYAAEMICRAGVGKMTIVDSDVVEITNRNRQLPALVSTSGMLKTRIMAARFKDINPEIILIELSEFLTEENIPELLDKNHFDYVVDAIDTIAPKVALISHSMQRGLNIASSMGAGGRTNPSKVQVADISKTFNCNLARVVRRRLSKLGINRGLPVIFSSEPVMPGTFRQQEGKNKKSVVGTISWMPAVFGCFLAGVVINSLLESSRNN